jgi:hypothetical protein
MYYKNLLTKKLSDIYEKFDPWPPDYSGWNGNHTIFHNYIQKTNPKVIIEVGTWKGQSALNMADFCKNIGIETTIFCIDTWLGSLEFIDGSNPNLVKELRPVNGFPSVYYQFISNVVHRGHQDIIVPIPQTSHTAAKYLRSQGITSELIYVDASHEYEDVIKDIKAYMPILNNSGIMFGDDYGHPGVREAVDEFFSSIGSEIDVVDGNYWTYHKE